MDPTAVYCEHGDTVNHPKLLLIIENLWSHRAESNR